MLLVMMMVVMMVHKEMTVLGAECDLSVTQNREPATRQAQEEMPASSLTTVI